MRWRKRRSSGLESERRGRDRGSDRLGGSDCAGRRGRERSDSVHREIQNDSVRIPTRSRRPRSMLESNLPVNQDGNHLSIDRLGDPEMLRHANLLYELTVPANTKLTFTTGSGDLSVEGIQRPGRVYQRLRRHGALDRSATSVRAHTCQRRRGTRRIPATGGIEVETSSGDVVVRLAAQVGYDLSAHTGSGDFSIGHELTMEPGDPSTTCAASCTAAGRRSTFELRSGDIRVD